VTFKSVARHPASMRLAATLLVVLALAGCLDPLTGRLRASDVLPPEYEVGDWFEYRLTSELYDIDATVRLVVANRTASGYSLGYPVEDAAGATLPLLFHMPAIGPVTDELAYDVHEERFDPIQWPLEDGKEWETRWITADVRLTAREANGTWVINNSGYEDQAGNLLYEIEYDPAQRAISRFARVGVDGVVRQEITLVATGTNHTGEVVAPGNIRVLLLQTRTAGALSGGAPASPQVAFAVPEGVDTLLVGCIAGGAPGQYRTEVRNAQGVLCELDTTVAPGASGLQLQAVEVAAEGDGWAARLAAAGAGSATAEVLGYPTSVFTLGEG
jgi:hypothetical protein